MPDYRSSHSGDAIEQHIQAFFHGHAVSRQTWPFGPGRTLPGFFVYEIGPGPRFSGWTYISSGAWRATTQQGHGLEFILSTNERDTRHLAVVTMIAYYHATKSRFDLGHLVPIGESWTPGSSCSHVLISLPYAYGPDLEHCAWTRGHARLLWALPITAQERAFLHEHGQEALEQRLDAAEIDFANPHRASSI